MAQATQDASSVISPRVTFRVALAVIALYAVVAVALLPVAATAGPFLPGFNALFAGGSLVTELATAFLLLVLTRQTARPSVLLLANAYLYSALMALAYVLSFSGAIARDRPLIGDVQTVSWVFNGWISGFALLAFAAVMVELFANPSVDRVRMQRQAYGVTALVAAITMALVAVFATQGDRLPQLVVGNSWSMLGAFVAYGTIVLLFVSTGVILLHIGRRNELFLWFSLALAAVAFGNIVSAVGGGRYTVGWYVCRLSWAASSSVLLLYFLGQFVRQHGLLARTTGDLEERTRERDRIWSVSEDLLGVSTFDGYFIAFNPAWNRVLGWNEAEVRRLHVDELRHPDDAGPSRAGRAQLATGVPTVRMQNRFRHKDGSWRWIAWTMTADQGLIYVAGRDVTAEKEAQEAVRKAEADTAHRQKMEALGQLTGGVAHDFNNLLMIVSGFIPRLKRHLLGDAAALEALKAIEIAAQRGASLTRQLLSFSRRQPVNPAVIEVGERIEALRPLLAGTVGPLITLRIEAASDTWPLLVDANEFELALLNLVLNARDAIVADGAIVLSARNVVLQGGETAERLAGEFVAVAVSDTGHGIAPDILPKVFDHFFTTKQASKGTGLGLSQVHGFTHQSGGTAIVDSVVGDSVAGHGTVVTLFLPRSLAKPDAAPVELVPAPAGGLALLVEDNPDVAMVGHEMLSQLGYDVRVAADARRALDLMPTHRFDLVVSDVVMPGGMNGVELARTIRTVQPDLPILLVTGYAGSADTAEFPVLRKPYRLEQMRQAIADLVGDRPQRAMA